MNYITEEEMIKRRKEIISFFERYSKETKVSKIPFKEIFNKIKKIKKNNKKKKLKNNKYRFIQK